MTHPAQHAHPWLRLTESVRPAWTALLDVVYPPRCTGCGARLVEDQKPLCHRCLHRLERPDAENLTSLLSRLPEALSLDEAFALWLFDAQGTVQRVQHLLKYGNRPQHGIALGTLMGTVYRASDAHLPDLIVPIPLHRIRRYERGYNQSAMLARGLSHSLNIPASENLLVRQRATRSQTNLSRRLRWENVTGAFAVVEPTSVERARILLVDDVLTTGATLAAAALALKTAGATTVQAATLALARS